MSFISPSFLSEKGRDTETLWNWEGFIMDFNKYVKHERYYGNHIYQYHHKEVEKRFYKVLDKLGEPNGLYDVAFITLRLKSKSDKVIAWSVSNRLEWKLCKYFWGRKGKKMLINHSAPFVSSVEENLIRFKDHIHALVLLKDLKQDYSYDEIKDTIKKITLSIDEVNSKDPEAVEISIFPFSDKTEELEKQVGNKIEYICKTASKHYNPLERVYINKEQLQSIKTNL